MSRPAPATEGHSPGTPSVLGELRQLLGKRPQPLRFEAEVEARFKQATAHTRLRHVVANGWIALFVFNGFLLTDWLLLPDVFDLALVLRLGIFTPLALALLAMGMAGLFGLIRLPEPLVEVSVLVITALAAVTLGVLIALTDSPQALAYPAGLVPVLMFGNLVERLRFRYAVVFSACVVAIYVISMAFAHSHSPDNVLVRITVPLGMLVVATAVYSLIANYRMEFDDRQRFLRSERGQALSEQLRRSREQLQRLAHSDPLTGLPNRRQFDAYLSECWTAQCGTGRELALLLIDVDHFKPYNDRYGHPAGDECLRLVARAVADCVQNRGPGLAARWGGEEFAVLLPETDLNTAMQLASQLRQTIQTLSLRHETSPTSQYVSVSIGVATQAPKTGGDLTSSLLSSADLALYRAKAAGRNRCFAHEPRHRSQMAGAA